MSKESAARDDVFMLLVETGRGPDDGLPDECDGAGVLCHAPGRDEAEAVRETVELLRQAGFAPLDVTSYGTAEERAEAGEQTSDEDAALIARARTENAVMVVAVTPFLSEDPRSPVPDS
ncbi:MAG: hypothetical protein AAGD12_12700 [Pseudomonadota bacterium]